VSPINLFRTSTFRLAVLYLGLFGTSVLAVLAFIYWSTAAFMVHQSDQTIEAEITGLAEHYRQNGLTGLVEVIGQRSRNQRHSLYLLSNRHRAPIVGNLDEWPPVATDPRGWMEFPYRRPVGGTVETHEARARHLLLRGGYELLVGRDVQERRDVERTIRRALAWSLALTVALGLLGGWLMSRNMLRRIDAINQTSRAVMAGNLHERVVVTGSDDELDRLGANFNAMLERIETLMNGMRQVSSNIAHNLRSPLNRLRSRLEVTLMETPSLDGCRAALESTVEEADRLNALFNALLGIARVESGVQRDDVGNVDLGSLVGEAVDLYEPVAEEKGLALAWEPEQGVLARANGPLVLQAIANLIDNAIKYTPAPGRIDVSVTRRGDQAQITVADSGPGIPEKDRDRVIEKFVRLGESGVPGSGLGLAFVHAVATLHDTRLELDDNKPGLRASLRLPVGH
jgi:signal transduction histidine kinase